MACAASLALALFGGVITTSVSSTPASATANPPFIDPSSDWLATVNYFREMSGLSDVSENAALSAGAVNHSCYMLFNGITHDEVVGNPGYTANGATAGHNGNVAVSSVLNATARSHIELWMTGPFHAIGVLRPNLQQVGFGKCDNASTPQWHSGATLDVINGLGATTPQTDPIVFPGNGTTTSLSQFQTESPNPLDFCGWTGTPAGLPIVALMPEGFTAPPTATISGSTGSMQTCVLSSKNTTGVAQQILAGNNSVVVIPRSPLPADTYSVSITTSARTVGWSFTVDPSAATGVQPVPVTTPLGAGNALQALAPARLVDTRINQGSTRLVGTVLKRIQIAGVGGVPAGATAVSANFTITGGLISGFLTVWNCAADRPVISTLNFAASETVPNGATVPLDPAGGLCVYSSATADLLIDVNGYYSPSAGGRFASVPPTRLVDTRVPLGAAGRLSAGSVLPVQVAGVAGVPNNATLVALNVTSVSPSEDGFITVYPCDQPRPVVSSLNPVPGRVKPNLVITPVGADGTVCLYTLTDVDVVVDITGYVSAAGAMRFTPTTPFRLIDTRERNRPELQAGTNGSPVAQGQVLVIQIAGNRGIASDAKAVSANLTVTNADGAGFVTAWPCGLRPSTSTVNFVANDAIANGAQIPLSSSGQLCLYASMSVHVIVDVNGWWS